MLVGCGFAPTSATPGDGTMMIGDGTSDATADARPLDAKLPADARVCPAAPAGCVAFACTASSSCYYDCLGKQAWPNAASSCVSKGLGCIATIDDQAEQTCITTATVPMFPDIVWFGWKQAPGSPEPAGGWGWQCGTSAYVAPNWGVGEPNNQGGHEDCGAMTGGGGWIDGDCSTQARYVCEIP